MFEWLDDTHCCNSQECIVKTWPLDKRYPQKYPDQTGKDYKGDAQSDCNDDIPAVISVCDDGVRWVVAVGDMQLDTLRHFSRPLDGALGRESRVFRRIKQQLFCEVKESRCDTEFREALSLHTSPRTGSPGRSRLAGFWEAKTQESARRCETRELTFRQHQGQVASTALLLLLAAGQRGRYNHVYVC
jgi:hypothetical protein